MNSPPPLPYPMASAVTEPHSAGTQNRKRERGIKEGFLEEEMREPVLKSPAGAPKVWKQERVAQAMCTAQMAKAPRQALRIV